MSENYPEKLRAGIHEGADLIVIFESGATSKVAEHRSRGFRSDITARTRARLRALDQEGVAWDAEKAVEIIAEETAAVRDEIAASAAAAGVGL